MRPIWLVYLLATGLCWSQGVITTLAGTDFTFAGEGKAAATVPLGPVFGMALSPTGEIFVSAPTHSLILRIGTDGLVKVVAGNGIRGFSGEGANATSASLDYPLGLALDPSGNLYVADQENQRVRRIDSKGVIETIAGGPSAFDLGDGGPSVLASLSYPSGLAADRRGNIYIADTGHHRIRMVSPTGIITTVAGNGTGDYSGDGGPAVAASLNGPQGLVVDDAGNIFIADSGNNRIRRVALNGIITTIAGTGTAG
ncbi:MAG: hypothetical protein M3Y27_08965, partial [Acidobacteriota bacterium]|nr:hypothetical protein [Acidobacteriota bacterium]